MNAAKPRVLGPCEGSSGFLCIGTRARTSTGTSSRGGVGALLGDHVLEADPGSLLFKPRHQWHTFWNAGDTPARILEVIAPAGFERYFVELVALGGSKVASPQALKSLAERYSLEVDPRRIPTLLERFQLRIGEPM